MISNWLNCVWGLTFYDQKLKLIKNIIIIIIVHWVNNVYILRDIRFTRVKWPAGRRSLGGRTWWGWWWWSSWPAGATPRTPPAASADYRDWTPVSVKSKIIGYQLFLFYYFLFQIALIFLQCRKSIDLWISFDHFSNLWTLVEFTAATIFSKFQEAIKALEFNKFEKWSKQSNSTLY